MDNGYENEEHPEWMKTIDGVTIVPGLRVWDYDLERSIVAEYQFDEEAQIPDGVILRKHSHYGGMWWDGWFDMRRPGERSTAKSMNGERMWTRHPATGEKA